MEDDLPINISRGGLRRLTEEEADQMQLPLDFSDPAVVVRPEYNIGKYAGYIFSSPYAKDLHEERVYSWSYKRTEDDNPVDASLVVIPLKGRKTPTTTTQRVYYGLIEAWEQQGRPADGEIVFSARALSHLIGWKWAGAKTAGMIQEHLDILKSTQIKYFWAYKDKTDELQQGGHINIIDDETYMSRRNLFDDQKFTTQQRVRLNKEMVDNMLHNHTRPVNHEAFKQISNDTAANLYTIIDLFLSGKPQWSRRSKELLYDELGLKGERYKQRKHRHAYLKKMVADLNGKPLVGGKLKLWIEETVDKKDWKLMAKRISDPKQISRKPRAKTINSKDDALVHLEEIIARLSSHPRCGKPNRGFLLRVCEVYPRQLIDDALSMAMADFRDSIQKTMTAAFVSEVRRLVTERKDLEWIGEEAPKQG